MEDRNVKWRVGVVAVATFVITALLIAVNTSIDLPFGGSQYMIQISVDRAPGVGRSTPVRRDGVLIGRVEKTEPIAGGRLITAYINQEEPILASDTCRIRPSSMFGDAVIDFVQTGQPAPEIEEGAQVNGSALPDPIEALTNLQTEVSPAIKSLSTAGEAVTELAGRLNVVIGDDIGKERVSRLLDQAIVAMESFDVTLNQVSKVATDLNNVIGDEQVQGQFRQALIQAPNLMADIRAVAQTATTTIQSLDSAVTSAERNLQNIEGLTKPIGERGPELAQSVISALENLDLVLADARRFTIALNNPDGTLGQLLSNRELNDNLNTTIKNANVVIGELYQRIKDLEPILRDVRIATDKVAREPGRLIGGALNKGPGLK